jgi:hypothetical protein
MNFAPVGSTTVTSLVPLGQSEGGNGSTFPQPAGTTLPPQFNPVFTNSPPFTTSVQGGSTSGLPLGWDPVTGFGMPPGSFTPSTLGQNNTSPSQPMGHQQNVSASQSIVQDVSSSQLTNQTNTSAS